MDKLLLEYVEKLRQAGTIEQYDRCIQDLEKMLRDEKYDQRVLQTVGTKKFYTVNTFSDVSTKESMAKARDRLVNYLESISHQDAENREPVLQTCLRGYLHNFYFFLESFSEAKLHKKASLSQEAIQSVRIKNEYDLQHCLYAALKPLFPDIRAEAVEDTGCKAVKSDLKIPSLNTVIEIKCTRTTMTAGRLTEEIEADIVHYEADYIYFYIYDKEKIISNKAAMEKTFNRKFDGKTVEVIILQPVNL